MTPLLAFILGALCFAIALLSGIEHKLKAMLAEAKRQTDYLETIAADARNTRVTGSPSAAGVTPPRVTRRDRLPIDPTLRDAASTVQAVVDEDEE